MPSVQRDSREQSKRLSLTVGSTVEAIRSQIRSEGYRFGTMIPSEHDLANHLGVSRGTVRRAIDVLVETGELSRKPHSRPTVGLSKTAVTRGANGSDVHVWVSHPIADEPTLLFMKGISRSLTGTPYRMVVREPTRFFGEYVKADERQFLLDLLSNESVAGAIVQRDPYADNADVIEMLIDSGKDLVFVDIAPPVGLDADYVGTANTAAARRLVTSLLELGHRHIACVADSDIPDSIQDRVKGYRRAMRHAGLADSIEVVIAGHIDDEDEQLPVGGPYAARLVKNSPMSAWAQRIVVRILDMNPRPTALFVCYDVLAYWICAYLEGAGIRIPGDMSVVGFDWLARWDDPATDLLTTASQDFEGFGRHAADLLLDRIADGYDGGPRHVLLDAPLVARSSTALALAPVSNPARGNQAKGL